MEAVFFILKSLYFILPGAVANITPVLCRRVRFLEYPVDFNIRWKGKPLLGANKTFRGVLFGTLSAMIIVYFQGVLFRTSEAFQDVSIIGYGDHNIFLLGFLIGFGTLFGDLVESFFKRRFNILPGKPWIPWDQLDSILGMFVFLSIVYIPPWNTILLFIIAWPIGHIVIKHVGYFIGINKEKW